MYMRGRRPMGDDIDSAGCPAGFVWSWSTSQCVQDTSAAPAQSTSSDWLDGLLNSVFGVSSDGNPGDDVNQTASGTGVTSDDFSMVGGVCKARNFPALSAVKAFQSQLNRIAQVKGFSKITVDGDMGPATMALYRQAQNASAGVVSGDSSSCSAAVANLASLTSQATSFANNLGAPATVSQATSGGSIYTKSGATVRPPGTNVATDLIGQFQGLSGVQQLAVVAVGGGVLYMFVNRKKKSGGTRRSSRR